MSVKRRISMLLAVTALSTVLGTAGGAGTASAADDCSDLWSVKNNSDAVYRFSGNHALKAAPAGHCKTVRNVKEGTKFYAWCEVYNSYNEAWVWGRIEGTETNGWAYVGHIWGTPISGTIHKCPYS